MFALGLGLEPARRSSSAAARTVTFGWSVALSATGDTALIGGPGHSRSFGAAWVFARTGSTWSQQGGKLEGEEKVHVRRLGRDVALSADGNTALVGGPSALEGLGAAWVFTRSGTVSQQGGLLTGGEEGGAGHLGRSAALSADGSTALLGGPAGRRRPGSGMGLHP